MSRVFLAISLALSCCALLLSAALLSRFTMTPRAEYDALRKAAEECTRVRNRCFERVEAEAKLRVDGECKGAFIECPAHDAILEDLRNAQEACP